MQNLKSSIAKVLDDANIRTYLPARIVNYFIIGLILVTSVMVIQDPEADFVDADPGKNLFNFITIGIFTLEYMLRIWVCGVHDPKYRGLKGKLRYMISFYSLIDLLAILPFYISLSGAIDIDFLKIFRLFRLLRMARYLKSFEIMIYAVRNRVQELAISMTVVFILLLVVSVSMYYVEKDEQPEAFSSIPATMWWGVATLTTVGYGDISPKSPAGKVLGGVVAILGIGLFALPAGIIGSGFVDEIEKVKAQKQNKENADILREAFKEEDTWEIHYLKESLNLSVSSKSLDLNLAMSNLELSEDQIFRAVHSDPGLRLRNIRRSPNSRYTDWMIIEKFVANRPYGACMDANGVFTVISPLNSERAFMGHFASSVAWAMDANYLANEYFDQKSKKPEKRQGFTVDEAYREGGNARIEELESFREDALRLSENASWTLIMLTSPAQTAQIHLNTNFPKNISQQKTEQFETWKQGFSALVQDQYKWTLSTESVFGKAEKDYLGNYIQREAQTPVITMFLDHSLLQFASDESYYNMIREIADLSLRHLI